MEIKTIGTLEGSNNRNRTCFGVNFFAMVIVEPATAYAERLGIQKLLEAMALQVLSHRQQQTNKYW